MCKNVTIKCQFNHTWETKGGLLFHTKTWCPTCFKENRFRVTINEMGEIAKQRGDICISKVYVNNNTKLEWRCGKGHIWTTTPKND